MKCDHRRLFSSLPFDLLILPPIFLLPSHTLTFLPSLAPSFVPWFHGRGVVSAPCHEKRFAKNTTPQKAGTLWSRLWMRSGEPRRARERLGLALSHYQAAHSFYLQVSIRANKNAQPTATSTPRLSPSPSSSTPPTPPVSSPPPSSPSSSSSSSSSPLPSPPTPQTSTDASPSPSGNNTTTAGAGAGAAGGGAVA